MARRLRRYRRSHRKKPRLVGRSQNLPLQPANPPVPELFLVLFFSWFGGWVSVPKKGYKLLAGDPNTDSPEKVWGIWVIVLDTKAAIGSLSRASTGSE